MIFTCDKCHFIFSRTVEPEQCPDCGKYAIRKANEAEKLELSYDSVAPKRKRKKELANDAENPVGH